MNQADVNCKTLDQLDRAEAVRALHQALMQFNAIAKGVENVANAPVVQEITRLLRVAGHVDFTEPAPAPPENGLADTSHELSEEQIRYFREISRHLF